MNHKLKKQTKESSNRNCVARECCRAKQQQKPKPSRHPAHTMYRTVRILRKKKWTKSTSFGNWELIWLKMFFCVSVLVRCVHILFLVSRTNRSVREEFSTNAVAATTATSIVANIIILNTVQHVRCEHLDFSDTDNVGDDDGGARNEGEKKEKNFRIFSAAHRIIIFIGIL